MHIEIEDFAVFPLFPQIAATVKVKEDISKLYDIKKWKFEKTNMTGSRVSQTFDLFSEFPKEKQIVMEYFNRFKNNVIQFGNVDFKMTTSWATECFKNEWSEFHNHKNCVFSAVMYLDDVDNGGELCFSDLGVNHSGFLLGKASSPNPFNSDNFYIKPEKNNIVFFSSHLMHRIMPYYGSRPRYSIAMNFIPSGNIGEKDSSVNLT